MLSTKQQTVFNWLKDVLQLPVYADVYKGALELLEKTPCGYITFVSHAGRDLINCLATTTIGADHSRDEYKNNLDNLKKGWKKDWGVEGVEEGHFIPDATCKLVQRLIDDDEAGRLRASELVDLFFNTFLDYADREKISQNLIQKSEEARIWFQAYAHVREPHFRDNTPSEVERHFRTLDEMLYTAASSQFGRIKILDGILKSKKKPKEGIIVDRALRLINNGFDRKYFFTQLKNPKWVQPLADRGCFRSPPRVMHFDDGYVQFPLWPELQYLKNVTCDVPSQVVDLVLGLPKVDNPSVYDDILEIALELPGVHSAKLMPKIRESLILEHHVKTYQFADLLVHWASENQEAVALELSKALVAFVPDPEDKTKRKRRGETQQDSVSIAKIVADTQLEPSPRIDRWDYLKIMSKGVRPLAERQPFAVARILIEATANLVRLRAHYDDIAQKNDLSEAWCERLYNDESENLDSKKALIHTLTFACEQTYQKLPDVVPDLDSELRSQQWKIFKRLRQHLCGQFPSEQTKPWIQELILHHKEYHLWEHRYEFQQLIRKACEHFGPLLLTEGERTQIFDAICSGPSKANYQAWVIGWLGEEFTEERFQQHQRNFQRKQFKPFESVLFGKYETYFRNLENDAANPISDEDYPPIRTKGGPVATRSPHPLESLNNLTDEELLATINEWEGNELCSEGDSLAEINIEGLAEAFQTVLTKSILPDANRLRFWIENCGRIQRPIYARMMMDGMQKDVMEKNYDRLNEWLTFCEWVLSQPHEAHDTDYSLGRQGDEPRENPDWYNARERVGDFIDTCLEKDLDVPVTARGQIAKLLEMLCTQFDRHLDQNVFHDDLIDKAINSIRGRALRTLAKFGYWLRMHDSESELPEITAILEKRFASETAHSLTLPEYAILGRDYRFFFSLNETWASKHKPNFFPQVMLPAWLAAFSSFLHYNDPIERTFVIFRHDFDIALQYLIDLKKHDGFQEKEMDFTGRPIKQHNPEELLIDSLSHHLFCYYLWGMYPLKRSSGHEDRFFPLELFYQVTTNDREQWANLFYYVGDILFNAEHLPKELKDRIIAFFDWRFAAKEPTELQQFTGWLEAECLEAEWRLDAYAKILDVCQTGDMSIAIQVDVLCKLLPGHTANVMECFVKLTNASRNGNIYIYADEAKTILKAGLESADKDVRENAERARGNLLRLGRFELVDLAD